MRDLDRAAAARVDRLVEPCLGRLAWRRVLRKLAGLIVAADTEAAAARAERARVSSSCGSPTTGTA